MNRKFWRCMLIIFATLDFSCERIDQDIFMDLACVRGKYLGQYCEGMVIQILDDANIGKDFESIYTNQQHENAVVASVDSLLTESGYNPTSFFSVDSTFYFQYKDGGYPRKQYNVCEPSPFITVITISIEPCAKNENE